ncbi:MAG TPA: DUF4399 domain-containing protein [Ginsengibacter sp.]
MKKFLSIPSILLVALVSCNSGTGNESSTSDSTGIQKDTSTTHADTSHMAMSTTTMDALPAIPDGAKVFFKNLKNGETVTSPVKVEMGATGISIDSAGTVKPNSGHFHLLIDAGDSIPAGVVVPKDSTHFHYGNAQKEATINLSPGKHTVTLQFADGIHRSYGSKLAEAITLNVKK